MCALHARQLLCLYLFCEGFALVSLWLPLNNPKISLSSPPRVQENKYARLVILLQLSLPADRVTWSSEARRLAF